MDKINMREAIDHDRRRFFSAAALTFTAAELGVIGAARAEPNPATPPVIKARTNTSFGPLKQIDAGVLNVGYVELGPPSGSPVFLLHGWPYDIHDYVEVAPILAAHGYRVIVPHLRGHGSTSFLDTATSRSGQQAAIGVDVVALMDALKIPTAVLAGYDWGGGAACVVAALWPERCTGLVSVNDYLIQDIAHAGMPLPPRLEWGISALNSISRRNEAVPGGPPIEMISRASYGPTNRPPGNSTKRPFSEATLHSTIRIMLMW
jgi:pimeloyl-ACP methyl ester carboxylesterase